MGVPRWAADLLCEIAAEPGPATGTCPSCGKVVTVEKLTDPCPACNCALAIAAARLIARVKAQVGGAA